MLEKHHIIFKSQGGIDFPLNFIYLSSEDHRGKYGPHMTRSIDLQYKKRLEHNLRLTLKKETYTVAELISMLELKPKQAYKAFRQVKGSNGKMNKEDVVFKLLGERYYI